MMPFNSNDFITTSTHHANKCKSSMIAFTLRASIESSLMLKLFLCTLYFLSISHDLVAGEKAILPLTRSGFTKTELEFVLEKYPELNELDVVLEPQTLSSENNKSANFTLKLYAEFSDDVYIIQKTNSNIEIDKTFVPFEIVVKSLEGEIHNSLYETLKNETNSEKISKQISEAFKDDFSTTKGLRVKAAYSFDVIEYFENGIFIKYGDVIKASLMIGQAISTKNLQQDLATLTWKLLPEILEKNERPFYAPVRSSRVSSLFQLNRRHPVTRRHQPHNGIDFVALSGTAVYPALEGEVVTIGRTRSKGKFILIQHDNGYLTTYDHLKKFKKGLRIGMRVEMQDQIGEVGRTGYATGAHLHFGVIYDGYFVNPISLVKDYCFDQKDHHENFNLDSDDQSLAAEEVQTESVED